jgi:outer membrane protein OmpA-like peptidoglycan-associated protein
MPHRHRLTTALSIGFLLLTPTFVFAQDAPAGHGHLQKECADAGIKTAAECKAFLAKQKAGGEAAPAATVAPGNAAADQAAADKAAADKAAADKAAADKAAADKAAADKAAADKAAADAAAAQAAADKAAADKAAADKAAADKAAAAAAAAAAGPKLPRICLAAGLTTQAECDALIAKQKADKAAAEKATADKAAADKAAADKAAADKAAADKAAADKAAADKAAADKAAADKAAADKAAADKAAADAAAAKAASEAAGQTPATNNATPQTGHNGKAPRLPQDCLDAGIKTQADCDAFHAIAAQKGKATAAPATSNGAPASDQPATGQQPAGAVTPADQTGQTTTLPSVVTPAKPGHHQQADQPPADTGPALPNIERPLKAAANAYNRLVAELDKAGGNAAAADKAKAGLKAEQAKMDALCKSNQFDSTAQCLAQFGIELAPLPPTATGGAQPAPVQNVQPVEVINKLPQGVTKQEVAPLLDSAKDQETGKAPVPQDGQPAQGQAVTGTIVNTPPPTNDKAAQAKLKPTKFVPIDQQQGQKIDPAGGAPLVQLPQNVTIINQTVVNNTTNVTNNVQNNNGPGVQQNGAPGAPRPSNGGPGLPAPYGGQTNPIGLGFQVILQIGNQLIINSSGLDQRRIANRPDDHTFYEQLPNGRYRETIERPDGVRIVTVYNRNGDILRRSRFDRQGHEIVLAYFDDRYDNNLANWRDPGEDLPPLRLRIPARDYVLDADQADETQVQDFFAQPPVEQVQRLYSIDEVKRSARIRDMVRRLEIGDLTFDTGAATISEDQVANLSKVAQAMLSLLDKDPAETFLIEGHTDAVGSDVSNLKLSDARAATVAQILTDFYHIPPENLATQGYGERYLKVQTDGPERLNRRVTIRRITPLVTVTGQNY